MKIQRIFISIILGLSLVLSFVWLFANGVVSNVYAQTTIVSNTNPSGPGSLRQAIIDTNHRSGHDTITFASNVMGTISLTDSLPAITDNLTINGPGLNQLAVSGVHLYRVFSINANTMVTLTDLAIQDGFADRGGGIWSAGNLQLNNTLIFNNETSSRGGGIFIDGGSVLLTDTQVISNLATSRGGGIYMWQDATTLAVNYGRVEDNSAGYSGGGICVERGNATLTRTSVIRNSAQAAGGGIFIPSGEATLIETYLANNTALAGGGIFIEGESASAMLLNTEVVDNKAIGTAPWGGGGLYIERGRAEVVGTHFIDNLAADLGGGVCALYGSILMTATQVISNTASEGGGIYLNGDFSSGSNIKIDNTIIANNEATSGGGGIHVKNNHTAHIRHNTIVGNEGESGIYVETNGTVNITNTILVSHTVGITVTTSSTATLENTLWGDGIWANNIDWGGPGTLITGTINLWGNPAFVAPEIGNYHLSQNSTALDAAADLILDTDIDGDPRPIRGIADIGADERKIYIYLPLVANGG